MHTFNASHAMKATHLPYKQRKSNLTSTGLNLVQTLWLALEEAMAAGVVFPDVLFIYNAADHPACNLHISCE